MFKNKGRGIALSLSFWQTNMAYVLIPFFLTGEIIPM